MPYKNRVRLPVMFTKPQFPTERNVFRLADGSSKVLSIIIRNTYEGKTDQLPKDWHQKLVIAMAHDSVTIENERLMSNVVLDGDYGIDWQDFLQYPIAQANFNVQVTPFNATNSNCQTCDQMIQLNLVDDSTVNVWSQGTTNIFPDVLTDNDSICCAPYVITLVNYNVLYFTLVTISAVGVLTATVINPAPIISNVWIAKYRVTCPDGSYDEADVYGNINGSSTSCPLSVDYIAASQVGSASELIEWNVDVPAPWTFIWTLYFTSDLGTPIQSGTLATGSYQITLTGLTTGVSYTFVLVVDCSAGAGTSLSPSVSVDFTLTNFGSTCGNFTVTYLPNIDPVPQSISYMDCSGGIVNTTFGAAITTNICMLITAGSVTPLYFVASSNDISINYVGLCP